MTSPMSAWRLSRKATSSRAGTSSSTARTVSDLLTAYTRLPILTHPVRPSVGPHAGSELGYPHDHLGAGADRCLDHQTVIVAEGRAQSMVDIGQPDVRRGAVGVAGRQRVARPGPQRLGIHAHTVVLDRDDAVG